MTKNMDPIELMGKIKKKYLVFKRWRSDKNLSEFSWFLWVVRVDLRSSMVKRKSVEV